MKKNGINIGIFIASEKKGFLVSLGKILNKDNIVWFIAKDKNVKKVIENLAPELVRNTITLNEYIPDVNDSDIIKEAIMREKKYGEYFSMLTSYDRGLGQGYLLNADRHPYIKRSKWKHERKVKALLKQYLIYENIFRKCKFNMILAEIIPIVLDTIASYHNAKRLSLCISRYENKYMWVENRFEEKKMYGELINKYLKHKDVEVDDISYKQYEQYLFTANMLDYSYFNSFKKAVKEFIRQTYIHLKRIYKKDGYLFCGWIPSFFRSSYNFKYFLKNGYKPNDLSDYKIVFFPLHQEPEFALLNLSPEFNNSMEIVTWVSKSIPADCKLVIKENPWSFGIRSRKYYDNLSKMTNVILAHPEVSSLDWIKKSKLVVAITGTAGFEAIYFNKPVLSYGKHQVINLLPSVKYSNNYFTTREGLRDLLDIDPEDEIFIKSKYVLHNSLRDASFSIPGYEETYKDSDLHLDMAKIAVDRLYLEYPDVFY
ncbi:hypothetical protein ACFL2O_02465 [Thermodesulfobacteriota bacterium]